MLHSDSVEYKKHVLKQLLPWRVILYRVKYATTIWLYSLNCFTTSAGAAAIAPWFRLCLWCCGPGFKSQAHHLCFFKSYHWNCNEKRMKINKEARICPFLTTKTWASHSIGQKASFLQSTVNDCCFVVGWAISRCLSTTSHPIDTDKRVAPPIPFVYWFCLQNMWRRICCNKNKIYRGTAIAYQCPLRGKKVPSILLVHYSMIILKPAIFGI